MSKLFSFITRWIGYFICYTAMVLGAGALLGGLVHFVVATFTHPELSLWARFHEGAWIGFRFAGVWACGLAIVLCFIQAHHMRRSAPLYYTKNKE